MNTLVFNCGSSSLTYKVFGGTFSTNPEVVLHGKAHRVGVQGSEPSFVENRFRGQVHKDVVPVEDHRKAASLAFDFIRKTRFQWTGSATDSSTGEATLPIPFCSTSRHSKPCTSAYPWRRSTTRSRLA